MNYKKQVWSPIWNIKALKMFELNNKNNQQQKFCLEVHFSFKPSNYFLLVFFSTVLPIVDRKISLLNGCKYFQPGKTQKHKHSLKQVIS